jgi:hypothetical protein
MATINNILGQEDSINHKYGDKFDHSFSTEQLAILTGVKTAFTLTGYNALFTICKKPGSVALYSKTLADTTILTFASNSFRLNDNLTLTAGDYYFSLKITNATTPAIVYTLWFGTLHIEL